MNRRPLLLPIVLLVGFSSCYKLQSDEELRKDIVGTWKLTECDFPDNVKEQGQTVASPLRAALTFYADGTFHESGQCSFCSTDSCGSCWSATDCGCTWEIRNGHLVLIPNEPHDVAWLNREFPIKCLRKDILTFDNTVIYGSSIDKACFAKE